MDTLCHHSSHFTMATHHNQQTINSKVCEQLVCLETKLAILQSRAEDIQPVRHQRAQLFALQQKLTLQKLGSSHILLSYIHLKGVWNHTQLYVGSTRFTSNYPVLLRTTQILQKELTTKADISISMYYKLFTLGIRRDDWEGWDGVIGRGGMQWLGGGGYGWQDGMIGKWVGIGDGMIGRRVGRGDGMIGKEWAGVTGWDDWEAGGQGWQDWMTGRRVGMGDGMGWLGEGGQGWQDRMIGREVGRGDGMGWLGRGGHGWRDRDIGRGDGMIGKWVGWDGWMGWLYWPWGILFYLCQNPQGLPILPFLGHHINWCISWIFIAIHTL